MLGKSRKYICILFTFFSLMAFSESKKDVVDYVNPFIGTSNFGTTNPGAVKRLVDALAPRCCTVRNHGD